MVRPNKVLESIKTALKQSDRLPSATSYATFDLDTAGGQSNVRPPVIEITTVDVIRNKPYNTDFAGFATDDNGNQIGYIYHSLFEMPVQIDVWTAEGDNFDPDRLGRAVRNALYRYDDYKVGESLPDPDDPSKAVDEVGRFSVEDGSVEDDLTMTPALRRYRQNVEVRFHETVNTADEYGAEDYITTVDAPSSADMTDGSEVTILYDATPNEQSEADNY